MIFFGIIAAFFIGKTQATTVKALAEVVYPTKSYLHGVQIGGLSGSAYDFSNKTAYFVSDSKTDPRIFIAKAELQKAHFKLSFTDSFKIQFGKQCKAPLLSDFEGIVRLKTGDFFAINEAEGPWGALYHLSPKGKCIQKHIIPEFEETKTLKKQNNRLSEGLALSPFEDSLTVAIEGHRNNKVTPFFTFNIQEKKWLAPRLYPLGDQEKSETEMSVSEIMYKSEQSFLVVERGYNPALRKNTIRVFETQMASTSTTTLTKKILYDFKNLEPKIRPPYKSVDNIEAVSLIRKVSDKELYLLFSSDNNFNPKQRTQFLLMSFKN